MRRRDLALWCCTLLFVLASSSRLPGNSTTASDNERDDSTVRYEIHADVTATNRGDNVEAVMRYARENSTRNNDDVQFRDDTANNGHEDSDSAQHEFHARPTKERKGGGNRTLIELDANFTQADEINSTSRESSENFMQAEDRSNFTLYELVGKFYQDDKKDVVPYEACENDTCIMLCCPPGHHFIKEQCITGNTYFPLPEVYEYTTGDPLEGSSIGKRLNQVFQLTVHDPCIVHEHYVLEPNIDLNDTYRFLVNGSLHLPYTDQLIDDTYCLAVMAHDKYEIAVCITSDDVVLQEDGYPVGLIISLPFLLATFVVYSILPELQNMHGYTLRGYVGSLFVAYTVLAVAQLIPDQRIVTDTICITFAFIIHFSFLASFFWLNVMCFDIWWTFGGFRSLQGSMKQRERKKFVMYSIYAWGSASILTIVCAIMDFVPSVPKELIRPEIGATKCWFNTDEARAIYFYGPMSVTVICNICLFISTALKIVRHKKDTAHHLRSSESRRHDDNKQWFNLYLKLFIVMGINWSMEIISWLFKSAPPYVWYLTDLTNTLQGLIIFIIFVWKEKIKRLLLKRFSCQDRGLFSRNSTHSGVHSSASRTCTTTSGMLSLQEKVNPYVQTNCRAKSSSDEAE
ncbi:PREDICTED: G-protein coupled receptor Mth2-like isoform X3 [Vollenhovia emeryi]|nr:PREDICTED: G-protein coupled receptor Mth2-like isoform X3 [Vollenhovia emeryi]